MRRDLAILIVGFLVILAIWVVSSTFFSHSQAQILKPLSYFEKDVEDFSFSIPSQWGELKGVGSHDQSDTLYFQNRDGSIQAVRVVLTTRSGKHFFSKIAEARIERK